MRSIAITIFLSLVSNAWAVQAQVNNSTGAHTNAIHSGGYPVGTATNGFGNTSSAPITTGGGSTTTLGTTPGGIGIINYYNYPGLGYFPTTSFSNLYPTYPNPLPANAGVPTATLGMQSGYYRAQSGFYYPWFPQVYQNSSADPPIYMLLQGALVTATPPMSVAVIDMRQFIDDQKAKNHLDHNNYEMLTNRIQHFAELCDSLLRKGSSLNATDQATLIRELSLISAEIARSLTL